ncbi:MAG: NAD(P)H-dependent oxidoreductase [Actinomycetia bacterium]|nr:NAD(P)H-dependent oxidoreductase [Actinomycetes bacterium]
MPKLVLISGSLRAASTNSAVVRAAAEIAGTHPDIEVEIASVRDLPLFDEDLEAQGDPPRVVDLKRTVQSADVLLISTPEYNASVPGGLKNALDWLSRPHGESVLTGKPVATISASPSGYGASWSQTHLRTILVDGIGAALVNAEPVCVAWSDKCVTGTTLNDRSALAAVRSLVEKAVGHRLRLDECCGRA